jgi:hypothetical protein
MLTSIAGSVGNLPYVVIVQEGFCAKLLHCLGQETYHMWSSYRKVFVLSYCTILARKPTLFGHHTGRFLYQVIALSWPGNRIA